MDIRAGVLTIGLLGGCAIPPGAAPALPAGTVISMNETQMGAALGGIELAADNSADVAVSGGKFPVVTVSRFHAVVDAASADAARKALAPWFLGKPTPPCEGPAHDAPGLDVFARQGGREIGTAHVYLGCGGKAYQAYAAQVYAQYKALRSAARLDATPYANAPAGN